MARVANTVRMRECSTLHPPPGYLPWQWPAIRTGRGGHPAHRNGDTRETMTHIARPAKAGGGSPCARTDDCVSCQRMLDDGYARARNEVRCRGVGKATQCRDYGSKSLC